MGVSGIFFILYKKTGHIAASSFAHPVKKLVLGIFHTLNRKFFFLTSVSQNGGLYFS
eukprot:NODE_4617_length_313_cov_16.746212_g4535_i0.p1 GENE.NODE_4617_length_313_cov_16.746212_g4535_i0~~NODE_4617_length_313_cov_16.746212_g4535_i0.p1  ORF type:complete len:65 (-),score=20.91 NODE_4617_length_313_cov_16.746212_g4535_i0:117-287(-)